MLDIKKLLTKLLVKADVPKQLNATIVKPSSTGWERTYKTVSAMADYNMIGVRFQICSAADNYIDQLLIFYRQIGNWTQSITWNNGSTYVRGLVTVDWDTNEVGVALINGNINSAFCRISQVVGLSHK